MAKRTNIRKRGNRWCVYFRINGRQVWRSFPSYDEAELYLAQSQVKRAQGTFRRQTKIRFDEFAAEWIRDYARGNVRSRTFETYEGALRNHLVPEFGDLLLTQITRKTIDAFIADWLAGGARYQERLRLARELEAKQAREEDRDPRPVRLGRQPGTISNALTPLREMLGQQSSGSTWPRTLRPV